MVCDCGSLSRLAFAGGRYRHWFARLGRQWQGRAGLSRRDRLGKGRFRNARRADCRRRQLVRHRSIRADRNRHSAGVTRSDRDSAKCRCISGHKHGIRREAIDTVRFFSTDGEDSRSATSSGLPVDNGNRAWILRSGSAKQTGSFATGRPATSAAEDQYQAGHCQNATSLHGRYLRVIRVRPSRPAQENLRKFCPFLVRMQSNGPLKKNPPVKTGGQDRCIWQGR